jgi:tRNA(fMet)-specific endonuclease VapC
MPGRLLDTHAVIALFANNSAITHLLVKLPDVSVPVVAIGELFYGAEKSTRVMENREQVEIFIATRKVLPIDILTTRIYGRIKKELKVKGRPIPDNDIWIAALALHYEATLLTRDAHFREVDGLPLETW